MTEAAPPRAPPTNRGRALGSLFMAGPGEKAEDPVKTMDDWCANSWATIQVRRGDMVKKPRGGNELFLCFDVTMAIKRSPAGAPPCFSPSKSFTRQIVFDAYRGLYSQLAKAGVAVISADTPFPPKFTLGKLGYKPDEDFLSNRCFMLNKWFNSICARCGSFNNDAKMALFTFLNIHPRIDHRDEYEAALRGILSRGNVLGTELKISAPPSRVPAMPGRSRSQASSTLTFLSADSARSAAGGSDEKAFSDRESVLSGYTALNYLEPSPPLKLEGSGDVLVKGLHVSVTCPALDEAPGAVPLYKVLLELTSSRSDRLSVSYSFAAIAKLQKELLRLARSSPGLSTFPRAPRDASKAAIVCRELTLWMAAALRAYSSMAYGAQQALLRFLCIDVNDTVDVLGPVIAGLLSGDEPAAASSGDDRIKAAASPLGAGPLELPQVLLAMGRVQLRTKMGDVLAQGQKLQLSYCVQLSAVSEGLLEHISVARPFADFRALYTGITKLGLHKLPGSDLLINKFPKTYVKSALGGSLTSAEVISRLRGLHVWLSQLLGVFDLLPQDAKMLVLEFLEFDSPVHFDVKTAVLRALDPSAASLSVINARRSDSFDSSCTISRIAVTGGGVSNEIAGSKVSILGEQMQLSTRVGPPVIDHAASGPIQASLVLRIKVLTGSPNLLSPWEVRADHPSLSLLRRRLLDAGLTTAVYTRGGATPSWEPHAFSCSASRGALEETGRRVSAWFAALLEKHEEMPPACQQLLEDFLLLASGDSSTSAMRTIVLCLLRQQPVPAPDEQEQHRARPGGCHCVVS